MEDHVVINVTAAIKKLKMYFDNVNQSPVYYAATILNLATENFSPGTWAGRPYEHFECKLALMALWEEYKDALVLAGAASIVAASSQGNQIFASAHSEHIVAHSQPALQAIDTREDELQAWQRLVPMDPNHQLYERPVDYWRLQQGEFLRLSKMAIDCYEPHQGR
jgi:hypothetical protein